MHSAQEIITYLNNYIGQFGADNDQMFLDAISIIYKSIAIQANEPLTLAELKKMAGQPVWVKVIDHTNFADPADDFDGWGLCRTSWVRVWDGKRADLVHIDYHFENYGKEWVAYRYQPKEADIPAVDIATSSTSEADKWFQAIIAERECQDKKRGYPQKNTFCEWSSILAEETGKLAKELNELNFGRGDLKRMEVEAIQVAAVAFAILEQSATAAEITYALGRPGVMHISTSKELHDAMGLPDDYMDSDLKAARATAALGRPCRAAFGPYRQGDYHNSKCQSDISLLEACANPLLQACVLRAALGDDFVINRNILRATFALLDKVHDEKDLEKIFDKSILPEQEKPWRSLYMTFMQGSPDLRNRIFECLKAEASDCISRQIAGTCKNTCALCDLPDSVTLRAYDDAIGRLRDWFKTKYINPNKVEAVKAQKVKQEQSFATLGKLPQQESETAKPILFQMQKSLMKACCLYVLMSHDYADEQKNIGSVYAILQSPMGESYLDTMFDPSILTEDEMLCFYAYQVFRAGTPDMRAQVLAEARIEACACLEQHKTVGCDHNCLQCERASRSTKEAYAEAVEVVKAQKAKQERSAAVQGATMRTTAVLDGRLQQESKTTKSGFLQPIHEIGIIMLLKTCILYVLLNHGDHPEDEKVIGEAFDLLTNPSGEAFLDALFDDEKMPYYSSYLVFKQASPNLRGTIWSRVAMLAAVCVERVKTVGCKHDCLHCDLINGTGLTAYEQIIKGMVLSAYEQAIKVYNTYKAKHEKDIDAVLGKAGDQTI